VPFSKATTFNPRKTTWRVDTDGVAERVNPKPRDTAGDCSRPHWPIAYTRHAPDSIAAVVSARMAGSEWRRPCRPRVSGSTANTVRTTPHHCLKDAVLDSWTHLTLEG
jgi:hypothetical protein